MTKEKFIEYCLDNKLNIGDIKTYLLELNDNNLSTLNINDLLEFKIKNDFIIDCNYDSKCKDLFEYKNEFFIKYARYYELTFNNIISWYLKNKKYNT